MASSAEYMEYVAGQLSGAGDITYRKLFGEYGVYNDGKFFGTVEDNQFYIKITQAGYDLLPRAEVVSPREGARFFLIEELEDREFLAELVQRTCALLPAPKPRKRKGKP